MSRFPSREAVFRLHVLPCALVLERISPDGAATVIARAAPPPEGYRAALAALAPAIEGPVAAVLPASAFRARPPSPSRRTAVAALAVALGLPAAGLRVAEVPCEGGPMLAAVARRTLVETRDFLADAGIDLARVEPEPGFLPGAPRPRFAPEAAGLRAGSRLARARGIAARASATLAEGARHLHAHVRPALHRLPGPFRPTPRGATLGGVALAALIAVAALLPRQAPEEVAVLPAIPVPTLPADRAADAAEAPPQVVATLPRPLPPRPRALPPLTVLTATPPPPRQAVTAVLESPAGAIEEPRLVTLASRTAPTVPVPAPADAGADDPPGDALVAGRPSAEERAPVRVATLGPMARPAPQGAAPVAAPVAGTDAAGAAPRPMRRPGGASEPAPGPVTEARAAPDPDRPRPRPLEGDGLEAAIAAAVAESAASAPAGPIALASLPRASDAVTGLAAATAMAARPAPRPVPTVPRAATAAVVPAAQPARAPAAAQATTRAAAPARAPAPAQAQPQPARPAAAPQAAPVQVARATPAAQAPRAAPPAQTPARAAPAAQTPARAAPAAQPPAQQAVRGPVTLIGVFGSQAQRHALLRFPDGQVQRVRPGQTVRGVQVAGIAGDAVRVRVNGRENTLRLPD